MMALRILHCHFQSLKERKSRLITMDAVGAFPGPYLSPVHKQDSAVMHSLENRYELCLNLLGRILNMG